MLRATASLLVAVLLLLSLTVALPGAPAAGQTACHAGFAYQSENLSVWFHGKKAFVKVFQGNESDPANQSMYGYHGGDIVERDASNRTLSKMNLGRAYPQSSTCTKTEQGDFVNITITVTDDVKPVGSGNKLASNAVGAKPERGVGTPSAAGQATVDFVYHFNKSARVGKFDLHVRSWPWLSSGTLAYQFAIEAEGATVMMAENGVGIVNGTGAQLGYVEWARNANMSYPDGHEEEANVTSSGSATGSRAAVQLAFDNVTAGYDVMIYDPWLGVGPWVILGGHLYAVPLPPAPQASRLRI